MDTKRQPFEFLLPRSEKDSLGEEHKLLKEELQDPDESSRPLCGRDWILELASEGEDVQAGVHPPPPGGRRRSLKKEEEDEVERGIIREFG